MDSRRSGLDAEAELRRAIDAAIVARPGCTADVRRIKVLAEPLIQLPDAERLIELPAPSRAGSDGRGNSRAGRPALYRCARYYAQRGIPTVLYGAGPGAR